MYPAYIITIIININIIHNRRGNSLSLKWLRSFSNTIILRLNIDITPEVSRQDIFQHIHVIWVLNDDFVKSEELSAVTIDNTVPLDMDKSGNLPHQEWVYGRQMNEREKDVMDVLHNHLPCKPHFSNQFRLDMVLDDYLQQATLYNAQNIVTASNSKCTMPIVHCESILCLPHAVRLDVSVLLTTAILFKVPKELFVQTLEMLLLPHGLSKREVADLAALPTFAKTAVVCMIRRICRREKAELELYGHFLNPLPLGVQTDTTTVSIGRAGGNKETKDDGNRLMGSTRQLVDSTGLEKYAVESVPPHETAPPPLFPSRDMSGFRYLKHIRNYLMSPLPNHGMLSDSIRHGKVTTPFSEMEEDFLSHLPDIPTILTCPPSSSPEYRDWVSLAARHTIILMSRCPTCPPLTRSQRTKVHTDTHRELQPLLVAAEMTYEDLEIVTTGPALDGRPQGPRQVLSFGDSLPSGKPQQLAWNLGMSKPRNYSKPWAEGRTSVPLEGDNADGEAMRKDSHGSVSSPLRSRGVGEDMSDELSHDVVDGTQLLLQSNGSEGGRVHAESAHPKHMPYEHRVLHNGPGRYMVYVLIHMACHIANINDS